MPGTPGGHKGGAAGSIPPAGTTVYNTARPVAATDFIGCNTATSYNRNALGIDIGTTAPANSAAGKTVQWVQVATSALVPGDRVNIAAGIATKNAAGTHDVFAAAAIGDYLWVVQR